MEENKSPDASEPLENCPSEGVGPWNGMKATLLVAVNSNSLSRIASNASVGMESVSRVKFSNSRASYIVSNIILRWEEDQPAGS
jgi:hypothetical protein